ncbi:MAG: bifunctional riboflavin kinase/FAD synthetase [Omnitrophica bacterium]|nr:bifunctional riboflavin kinase/FAD synthetase [Candidatus Omnitrophota bacterium]
MKVIRDIKNTRHKFKKLVLTIGMFDGVHLAHQKIIKEVVRQAKRIKGTSMVLTFAPHPLRILKSPAATSMITALEHRIEALRQLNVDVCLLMNFNKEFSKISAGDFIKCFLVNKLGIDYLIVGQGFRFGSQRGGSFSLLEKLSKICGFKIREMKSVKINNQIISSSRIRSFIRQGKVEEAGVFLGRHFSIHGKVKKGTMRGRILGYPTANVESTQELIPACGVYAVKVKLNNKVLSGMLNIGFRPTFGPKKKPHCVIEVHVFNFRNKIYGQQLEVFFIQRIRSEKKFAAPGALLVQLKKDELKAKQLLKM